MAAKLKKLKETHGKDSASQTQPTSLEQIWGFNELARYSTKDPKVYQQTLAEMNRPDLEREARRIGEVVVQDTTRLRENLMSAFSKFLLSLQVPKNTSKGQQNPSDEVKRILAEGR